jgi:general secretion pathway protein J
MHTRTGHGFTLVEMLVALSILSLLALMGWRALDGMQRANTLSRSHTDAVLALDAGLGQWGADLNQMSTLAGASALDWDGRVLRITRRHSADADLGVTVVGWSTGQRDGKLQWLRWQSEPIRTLTAWQSAWQAAAAWAQNGTAEARQREVVLTPITQLQLFYFRNDSWSNPLSASGAAPVLPGAPAAPGSAAQPLPEGVRLVLTVSAPHPLAGTLTRDWVQPALGGAVQ